MPLAMLTIKKELHGFLFLCIHVVLLLCSIYAIIHLCTAVVDESEDDAGVEKNNLESLNIGNIFVVASKFNSY